VLAAEGAAFIVPTSSNVAEMRAVLPKVADLALRLATDGPIGSAEEEGCLPRGLRTNVLAERTGAARAVELLLAKIAGETRTEVVPVADRVEPPPALPDLATATVALVTEAGCVPQGNPDRLPSRRAHLWLRYSLEGVGSLGADAYQSVHGGFDTTIANLDLNRLVPLDAIRELEAQGRIGKLHDVFYTTTGVDTPVAAAAKFGQEIAADLHAAAVQAVILTGT
jgi:glycine reductase